MSGPGFSPLAFSPLAYALAPDDAIPYSRMLFGLLPPGKLWNYIDSSVLSKVLLACGTELARVELRVLDLLNEADPSTAVELLPEYERELDLDAAATTAERQARIVALTIAQPQTRPVDLREMLAQLLGQLAADVVILERTPAFAASIGDGRAIFSFFVYRNPALPGTYYLASAQALLDQIEQSHTTGYVIESISAKYGDPHTLYGRDLIGPP